MICMHPFAGKVCDGVIEMVIVDLELVVEGEREVEAAGLLEEY